MKTLRVKKAFLDREEGEIWRWENINEQALIETLLCEVGLLEEVKKPDYFQSGREEDIGEE